MLDNGVLRVTVDSSGTISLTDLRSGRRFDGLFELFDEADAGDEYGHAPIPADVPFEGSLAADITTDPDGALRIARRMPVPSGLTEDRTARSSEQVTILIETVLRLDEGSDTLLAEVEVDNPALDHRLRLRFPTGFATAASTSESAFGTVRRDGSIPESTGWQDKPSGVFPMRRFACVRDERRRDRTAGARRRTA